MHFCIECNNMYYLKLIEDDGNDLVYYCKNCGHENKDLATNNICVSTTQISNNEKNYNHIINDYIKLDHTLPRIRTIRCPNKDCLSNIKKKDSDEYEADKEVIYIRYDDINMKYIYMCAVSGCNNLWTTNNKI